jgi:formylmethanofuran dehydrogenase subunit E
MVGVFLYGKLFNFTHKIYREAVLLRLNDYNRKQSKKTVWDEELDSEESLIEKLYKANINNLTPYFDPYFSQNDYEGKKYKCNRCGNVYVNNETEIFKGKLYCIACAQGLHYDV